MIKIRLMGEREEIKIIIENISHINDVRILSLSDFYANRGGQVIMEESIWKWRKKMLCNVIWKGRV